MASRKPKHPAKRRPVPRLGRSQQLWMEEGLELAKASIGQKDWMTATTVLEMLDEEVPHQPEVLALLAQVYTHLEDTVGLQKTCEELLEFAPDPEMQLLLAAAYGASTRFVHAVRTLRSFLATWPDHPGVSKARTTLADIEPPLREMLRELGLTGPDAEELALQHERIQILLDRYQLPEARRAAEQFLKRQPDFTPVLNNLSQIHALEGHTEQAIATAARVLAQQPDNMHALGNIVHFLCLAGREDEARGYAEDLKAVRTDLPDLLLKRMEALSYLGDDQGVLEAFTRLQKHRDLLPGTEAMMLHLAAVATAHQGNESAARRHWKKALKLDPGLLVAQENLKDLDAPAEERTGAWPFAMPNWLALSVIQDLQQQVGSGSDLNDEAFGRAMRRFLRKHPEIVPLVSILLQRGDPPALNFALAVVPYVEDERVLTAVCDFALGKRGPLQQRHMAARIARRAGLLPGGSVRMWTGNAWTDMLLLDFEIHHDQLQKLPRAVERLVQRAMESLYAGDGETAEQFLRQALAQAPEEPAIRNNLAAALTLQGRIQESDQIISELLANHPDYLFARTAMAHRYVREGNPQGAEELLVPLLQRQRLHFSELEALCQAEIDVLLAQRKLEGARSWFSLWESTNPDSPHLERWRACVFPRPPLPWKRVG